MPQPDQTRTGFFYALAAFITWGLFPLFIKLLSHVPLLEILAQRVVWALLVCALLTWVGRDWAGLRQALTSRKVMGTLFITALLISANWLIYIYAVYTDRVLATSLGYFINPLVSVVLGVVILKEKLTRLQTLAVALAAAGTVNLIVSLGELPWISLSLPILFGFYGLLRKTVAVEAMRGLLVEIAILTPFALAYIVYLAVTGTGHFLTLDRPTDLLFLASGLATTLPLLWFTAGARRLHYSTMGLIQYLGPSILFILGVFVYGEPFETAHLITFAFIWCGLIVFAADNLRAARAARRAAAPVRD